MKGFKVSESRIATAGSPGTGQLGVHIGTPENKNAAPVAEDRVIMTLLVVR
jgi:hypothetical protein